MAYRASQSYDDSSERNAVSFGGGSSGAFAFADALADVVCVWAWDGRLVFVNRAWFAFTGQSRDGDLASLWRSAVHPDDVFRPSRLAEQPGAALGEIEFRLRRADGAVRPMRGRPSRLTAANGDEHWLAVCVDVSPRPAAEPERDGPRSSSDSRLRRLFEANVVGILIGNNAGAILEANDAFLGMIGYSRHDLETGRVDWRSLTPPECLPRDELAIEALARDGAFSPYEKEYVRKDGTRVPVSVGGARLVGTDDEQICYVVDLSSIRRVETALRRSEARFRRLTDANIIGIISSRAGDGTINEANDEFLRIVGYGREEFAAGANRWSVLTPPDWAPARERALAELREFGRFVPYEKEYLRKDGSRVPVLAGGALVEDSDDEIVSYVLDLSAQRDATREIQESERRYRILADALPQIIMLADEDRRLHYVNPHYEAYTGVTIDELPARWHEVIHPDDIPAIARARATGEPYEIEYRLRRASDGAFRWHFARCMKIPGHSPRAKWLAAAIDIDDRKRAEESLRFIEKAGSLLSQSLDLETTFETLMDLVIPEFGDWATMSLRDDDGRLETIAVRHRDPAMTRRMRELLGVDYFDEAHVWGTAAVYRTGLPQLIPRVTRENVQAAVKDRYVPLFEELGFGSFIALPVRKGDDVIGSFGIASAGGRRVYTDNDLPALEELARRAGAAIGNARLYQREHRVADILQEAALPRKLPVVDGFRFDGYYRAGRREAAIGGDWFDALVVADGRIVISLGDVAGSGLEAAVLMSKVRQIIRGAAHMHADPLRMFDVADSALRSEHEDSFVTAFVGVINPLHKTIVYASAGHLPALLRTADGAISELSAAGPPLGYRSMASSECHTANLPPGSCLLLYTDGLVEWSHDLVAGEALLRRRFAEAHRSGNGASARALVDSILPGTGALDDVAVLTVAIE